MATIITKNSSTPSSVPTAGDLVQGELAVNVADKRLFTEDSTGSVVELGTNPSSLTTSTVDIDGGNIDGVTIATSDVTVGSGKTLDVSAGTLTLANDQISGDAIDGGTATPTTVTSTTVNATTVDSTNLEVTNLKAKDGTSAGSIADSTGVVTLASSVLTTTDINGGSVDAVTLGTNSAVTEAQVDNININGNTISSTDTNGNVTITPDGTGSVVISKVDVADGEIDGTVIGANSASTGSFTTLNATGGGSLTGTWTDLGSVTTLDINGGTIDGTTQASGTINGPIAAGGTWTAAATWTLPALTLGGTVTSNGQSFSGTIADLGTVTTADINGGTIDNTVIGGTTPAAVSGTNIHARNSLYSLFPTATPYTPTANTNTYGFISLGGNSGGAIDFFTSGTREWEIFSQATGLNIYDFTTASTIASFNSSGLGIGTSPSFNLHVSGAGGGAGDTSIELINTGTGGGDDTILRNRIGGTSANNYIYFGDSDDSNAGQIRYQHSSDSMIFNAAAAERMMLNSSGLSLDGGSNYQIDGSGNVNPNFINLPSPTELTISSGTITVTQSFHTVDTQGNAASDDLDTINGFADGRVIVLTANANARTVVLKDGTGNLGLSGDFSLTHSTDTITLMYKAANSQWVELSRSDNAA